jgi:Icc-related predicted phosphoesterase
MNIITFSDTHNLHDKVILPPCDISIFAGDYSGRGNRLETYHFFKWYSRQSQCRYKVMTVGNHDICFDHNHDEETHGNKWIVSLLEQFPNIILLDNRSEIIEGIKIWGSPATPWYHGKRWAFNYKGDDIKHIWKDIPNDTDIIVTHGPVYGILDKIHTGEDVGCPYLLEKIKEVKPKFHICGHIHEGYGLLVKENTTFVNCSIVDLEYDAVNSPIDLAY